MSLSNFFEQVSVIVTAYDETKKLEFGFIPERIIVTFVSGTGPVFFSFNGDEDHGVVGSSPFVTDRDLYPISRNEIWLKGTAGDEIVQVTAWA